MFACSPNFDAEIILVTVYKMVPPTVSFLHIIFLKRLGCFFHFGAGKCLVTNYKISEFTTDSRDCNRRSGYPTTTAAKKCRSHPRRAPPLFLYATSCMCVSVHFPREPALANNTSLHTFPSRGEYRTTRTDITLQTRTPFSPLPLSVYAIKKEQMRVPRDANDCGRCRPVADEEGGRS